MDLCNNSKILIWQLYSEKDNRKILGVFSLIKPSNFCKSKNLTYIKTFRFVINKSLESELRCVRQCLICDDATKRTYCMLRTNPQWDTQWNMGKCYLKYLGFIMYLILNLFFWILHILKPFAINKFLELSIPSSTAPWGNIKVQNIFLKNPTCKRNKAN